MPNNYGLEMLLYDGVHPDAKFVQDLRWQHTWVPISLITNSNSYDYRGLDHCYFIDTERATLHCFPTIEEAKDYFDKDTCVWVVVSCHEAMRTKNPRISG